MKHRTQGSFIFSSFLLLISSASMCSNMQSNEASIDTFLPVFMSDYPSQKSFDGMINCEKPKKNNWQNPSSPDKTEFMTPSPEPIPFYDDNADGYFTPAIIPYIPGTPAEHLIPLVQRFEHAYMNDNDDANAVDGIIKVDKYLRKNTTSPLVATKNKYGHSPLYTAARSGSAATVSTLIKHNADVESKNGKNCKSPLCIAIQNGHLEIVQYMLEETKGKLADSPCDKDLNSPLHIENNNFHMTNLLLMEDRADIHAKNKYGKKPYQANLPTDVKELYDLKKIFDRELQAEEHPHMSSEDKRSQRLRNFNKPVEVKTSRSFMMRYLVPSCIQSKK